MQEFHMSIRAVRTFAIAGAAVAALMLGSHGRTVSHADDPVVVVMQNNLYQPDPITISAGTTVTWTNNEDPNGQYVTHDVITDDSSGFSSPDLNPGDTFSFTFSTPGTYTYYCAYHDGMDGTVIVQ
jgi:plastocyanin